MEMNRGVAEVVVMELTVGVSSKDEAKVKMSAYLNQVEQPDWFVHHCTESYSTVKA